VRLTPPHKDNCHISGMVQTRSFPSRTFASCCLGLEGQAAMPRLLSAIHEAIDGEINAFFWANGGGRLAGVVPEYFSPKSFHSLPGRRANSRAWCTPDGSITL
jgi:hypothetical protein